MGDVFHQPSHGGQEEGHDQAQAPVQVEQVADQCQQGQAVARDAEQRVDQQVGARLHFVDQGVAQRARVLLPVELGVRVKQATEHGQAKLQQTHVGHLGQRHLSGESAQPPHGKQANQGDGNRPQRQAVVLKTFVQQWLEQRGDQGLCQRDHDHRDDGGHPSMQRLGEILASTAQARKRGQRRSHGGRVDAGVSGWRIILCEWIAA